MTDAYSFFILTEYNMYNEYKSRVYSSADADRYRKDSREECFMTKRRKQREKISLSGVPEVWSSSPDYIRE